MTETGLLLKTSHCHYFGRNSQSVVVLDDRSGNFCGDLWIRSAHIRGMHNETTAISSATYLAFIGSRQSQVV